MENDYGFVDEIFAEGEDIETGISGPEDTPEVTETPYQQLSEAQEADPAAAIEQPQEQAAPSPEAPEDPKVDMAKAVGDYSNPNVTDDYQGTGEQYNPQEDAALAALHGLKNVTGIDLGVDEYIARQEAGETSLVDSIAQMATRIPAGAGLGAAEAVGSAAEIVGDTTREMAQTAAENIGEAAKLVTPDSIDQQIDGVLQSLETLSGAQEKNNPWSNQYEWAKWNLGKDELGAKSGIGKVVQGFGEFALLMAGTGGFRGFDGAGQAFAAATTRAGKLGVMGKAAALEGFYGIGADMISASKGEGNMANLVRDAFPSLENTFLTALAVDADDNPWEVAFKTALDGAALGMPIGAMGAWFSGARAARKALADGATQDEAIKAAFEASQEAMPETGLLYHGTTPGSAKTIREGGFRGGSEGTNILGSGVYAAEDIKYASVYGDEILGIDPAGLNIRDMDRPLLQFLDENGIEYRPYDLATGDDVDLSKLTPQDIADDVGFDISNSDKKRLRELLAEDGKYQGVRYDASFSQNERNTATETLIFDPAQARLWQKMQQGPAPLPAGSTMEQLELGVTGKANTEARIERFIKILDDDFEAAAKELETFTGSELLEVAKRGEILQLLDYVDDPEALLSKAPIDLQIELKGLAHKQVQMPNGSTVTWTISENVVSGFIPDAKGVPAYRVDWDIPFVDATEGGLGEGAGAIQLYKEFGKIAEELKPGAIVTAEAAEDGYGIGRSGVQARRGDARSASSIEANWKLDNADKAREVFLEREGASPEDWDRVIGSAGRMDYMRKLAEEGVIPKMEVPTDKRSIRQKLYERAGLSKPSGKTADLMVGIVKKDRSGRKSLLPYDLNKPFQEQYDEAVATSYSYSQGELDMSAPAARVVALEEGGRYLTPERLEAYGNLLDLEAKGITTTWDDAAAVVPEYFTEGTRAVEPTFNEAIFKALDGLGPDDGFTRNPFTGEVPPQGVAVAIDGAKLEDFSEDAVATFISQNRTALSREDVFLGAWKSEITGKTVVELSRIVPDVNEARFLGHLFDQEGVFDVEGFNYIPTGGKDRLLNTKFNNTRSPFSTPTEVQTVPVERAAVQQLIADNTPFIDGAPAQRSVTDAQLHILSQATSEAGETVLRNFVRDTPISVDQLARQANMTVDDVTRQAGLAIQDALGATGDIDFSKILTQQVGDDVLLSRAGIVQVRTLMTETANAIGDSAFKANTMSQQGLDATNQLKNMADQLKALLRIHKTSANAYSKYLSTYKIEVPELGLDLKDLPPVRTVDELAQNIQKTDELLDEMVKGIESGDPKARTEALRVAKQLELFKGNPAKIVGTSVGLKKIAIGKAFSIMYNSMLSSPTTHLVNTLSNAFNTVYRPLTALAGGDKRTQKAALASYHNFLTTIGDAAELAGQSFKLNEPVTSGSKMVQESQFTRELAEITADIADSGTQAEKFGVGFVNMLAGLADNPLLSLPSRLLTTSDEFFKTMVTRMEFNRKMMEKAIDQSSLGANNLQETFESLLKSEYSRNFTSSGNVLNEELLTAAKEVTFQTELKGAVGSFATFIDNAPALRIFFPFVKTGHNIMVYTGTHVPVLNLALKESRDVLLDPTADPYQKAIMKGRLAFGSMVMLLGGLAAHEGRITGNGPSDPRQRKEWLKTNQPRSIRLPDGNFLSMDRLEPFGQILSAVADIHYAFKSGKLEEDRAKYLSGYMMYAISTNLTDRSFLQGLAPLGNLLNPRSTRSLERIGIIPLEVANNFLPASGLRRAISNGLMPYMQEFNNEFDRLINSASAGLARPGSVSYDYLDGQTIDAPSGGINALLPMRVVQRTQDPVRDKLMDIEFNSSDIVKEVGGVKLTAEQITRIQQLMSETNLYKNLKRLMLHPKFDESVEQYKAELNAGSRVTKENQYFYRLVTQEVRAARDQALRLLRQEDPELDAEIEQAGANARFARTPNGLQDIIDYGN